MMIDRAKPILFNTEMVRAILENRKTVTRRVLKAPVISRVREPDNVTLKDGVAVFKWNGPDVIGGFEKKTPYRPGDLLYVRETFSESADGYAYKADYPESDGWGWRPSIHMPKKEKSAKHPTPPGTRHWETPSPSRSGSGYYAAYRLCMSARPRWAACLTESAAFRCAGSAAMAPAPPAGQARLRSSLSPLQSIIFWEKHNDRTRSKPVIRQG